MKYGRPRKYDKKFMKQFMKDWKESKLSLLAFCKHQKIPYVSMLLATKRTAVDKNPQV